MAFSSTRVDHKASLVDLGVSFYMTPHKESFYEYKRYNGGNGFLGDDSTAKIIE